MKDRKIKKGLIIGSVIVIIIIVLSLLGYKYINYKNSNFYKLKQVGFNKEEITLIEKRDKKEIEKILKMKYDSNITKLIKEKYFIFSNLDRYLAYQKETKIKDNNKIVIMVNVNRDYDYYDKEVIKSAKNDKEDEFLILVNKYYQLDKNFKPDDITPISNRFAYGTNEIRKPVYEAFRSMFNDAEKEGHKLIINSSFREYEHQERLWNSYSNQKGEEWADSVAARPGFSEHQTGLALDITTNGATLATFEETEEFKWLSENAYKYGFILRYPKGKENITGYSYESWHYRYVGEDIAKKINDLEITYDEYYAYYIENDHK